MTKNFRVKTATLALALSTALFANAEGYQVNTLSTRQIGMGHTGTALHLDAESMFFNPAGLGFMTDNFSISGSFTTIFAKATATLPDGTKYHTANDPSTPIMANAAFSIYDNLKAGVSFYTPYGSGINWTDNWPGAVLNQNVSLKAFTLQPTLSWRITDKLSVGAGLTINWGNVNLSKGLVDPATADAMLGLLALAGQLQSPQYYQGTMPASVNLRGDANVSCGFNVGVMYDILDNLSVGVSYRSKVKMTVEAGTAAVQYANQQAQLILNELDILNSTNFAASMPCPYVLSFGASWKPVAPLTLAVDARLTGWKTYRSLDIEFLDPVCAAYNQHIEKNYHNSWNVSVGAEYKLTRRFDLRAGLLVDTDPISDEHYNPETPGMTKVEPTVGFSFSPVRGLAIDVAMMYVAGLGKDNVTCSYPDLLAAKLNQMLPPASQLLLVKNFDASYKCHAFIPSIGIRYNF
ncbi:MAG: outer membrane protein transport protein [Muribaculaceae bacterium]|nr:outer membrane protein transport protein [Muribaculaceae bacterium]